MAGIQTTRLLAAGNYENFYELAHSYSELLLVPLIRIDGFAAITEKWFSRFPATPAITQAQTTALDLQTTTQQMIADLRQCFWPDGRGDGPINRNRWAPYNGQAWDRFFTEVNQILRPYLPQISTQLKQTLADAATAAQTLQLDSEWSQIAAMPGQVILQFQELLTATGFEAAIFNKHP